MPTATYDLIASTVLGSTTSSVTFSSLGSYRDLIIVSNCQSNTGNTTTALYMTLNSDTTDANYNYVQMLGNGSSATGDVSSSRFIGHVPDDGFSLIITNLMDVPATNKHKNYLSRSNNTNYSVRAISGRWANTSAITSIQLSPFSGSFRANSSFYLYGIVS